MHLFRNTTTITAADFCRRCNSGKRALLLVIMAMALSVPGVVLAKNHYIVLFDGSGSVLDQHKGKDNLWQGKTADNQAMAEIMRRFVDKALEEPPAPFPAFDPNVDEVSVLLFRVDFDYPSYRQHDLFLTNDTLVKSWRLPIAEDYQTFIQANAEGSPGTTIQLKDVFPGNQSPLVAATAASLPFLGEAFSQRGLKASDVDHTYIVRITDGDYNSEATAADEHHVIQRRAKAGADADDGFVAHKALSQQVNSVFEIGAEGVDCAFPTHNVRNLFDQPFNCQPDAYKSVSGWGKGFLISYLSVEPKVPALSGLARTAETLVDLDTIYRLDDPETGGVRLIGKNPISAAGYDDPKGRYRLVPQEMDWSPNGQDWTPCQLPAAGSDRVECGLGGPTLDYAADQVPTRLRYRVKFVMDFPETGSTPSLYPYPRRLGATELPPVGLRIPEPTWTVYDIPETDEEPGLVPSPKLLFSGNGSAFLPKPIDNAELARFAERWTPELRDMAERDGTDAAIITPNMIHKLSVDKKDAIEESQADSRLRAWLLYLSLLALVVGGPILFWLLWPRLRLEAMIKDLAPEGLLIDFNDTQPQRAELIAMVQLSNTRANLTYTAAFPHIQARLHTGTLGPSDSAKDSTADAEPLFNDPRRPDAPLAIGGPNKNAYREQRVSSGKELTLFFDPREIVDLNQLVGTEHARLSIPVDVHIDAGRRAGSVTLSHRWEVELIPERSKLNWHCFELQRDDDGYPVIPVEYEAGTTKCFATYGLRSSATHRYSYPVRGLLEVAVFDAEGNRKPGAIELIYRDERGERLEFYLRPNEPMVAELHLNFQQFRNPIERDNYRVAILRSDPVDNPTLADQDQAEQQPVADARLRWETIDEWRLEIQRASDRTDVSVVILHTERERSAPMNAARMQLTVPFQVGTPARPIAVQRQLQQGMNKHTLFKVRLGNACRNGHGHAAWQAQVGVKQASGVQFPPSALRLLDNRGDSCTAGSLRDSPELADRQLDLSAILDLKDVVFIGRDFRIEVDIQVDWEVHAEDPQVPEQVQRFQNRTTVVCLMRHEPPRHVLAIDFGTSAMAAAHAIGPRTIELLRLPKRLAQIESETRIDRRWDDPDKRNPYFLASEFNVCNDKAKLAQTRPDSPDFLDLPLILSALQNDSDSCFSSLKALISAGFTTLPIDARKHPYLNLSDEPDATNSPPLDAVIEGAYRGLMQHFIEPILERNNTSYSHVYITHPNTYTQNHVEQLRAVVEQVFAGRGKDENIVYPNNIHFISESDAVAYYYLMRAHELRTAGCIVPERERILVYDIGAGTLDLTYLEVDWIENSEGGHTPKRIRVLRRGGVTKAGDLLDECIARDLHAFLEQSLGDRYLTPIVVKEEGETMSRAESMRMDELRQQIHQLKADLSAGKAPRLELTSKFATAAELVMTKADETSNLYKGVAEIEATQAGKVYWKPRLERILDGAYVSAFIERVTRIEVESFLGHDLPRTPDTVILSGRTSLWPGFRERLAKTLVGIPNWVDFDGKADSLKQAVVLGVVEREYRWRNIHIEQPKTPGVFGVRYERRAGDWTFHPYPEPGKRVEFFLQDASEVEIGLKTNNGFDACYSLLPDLYYAQDCKLAMQLDFDDTGYLRVEVANTEGRTWDFSGRTSIPTLSYRRFPWPLGAARLHAQEPAKLLRSKEETE